MKLFYVFNPDWIKTLRQSRDKLAQVYKSDSEIDFAKTCPKSTYS